MAYFQLAGYYLRFHAGHDLAHVLFLPTYAATAWYHGKLDKRLQAKPLRALLDEVEAFAEGEYNTALFLGDKLPPSRRTEIIRKLTQYTGLSAEYIASTNLRIQIQAFGNTEAWF